MYNVMLDTQGLDPTDDQIDDWMTALAPYHAAMGWHPVRREVDFTLTLPGETLVQALSTAIAVVERTIRRPVLSAEVMPTGEFDRRNGFPVLSEQMSVSEIAAQYGITRQAVLKMVQARKFATVARVGDTWAVSRSEVYARQESFGFGQPDFFTILGG